MLGVNGPQLLLVPALTLSPNGLRALEGSAPAVPPCLSAFVIQLTSVHAGLSAVRCPSCLFETRALSPPATSHARINALYYSLTPTSRLLPLTPLCKTQNHTPPPEHSPSHCTPSCRGLASSAPCSPPLTDSFALGLTGDGALRLTRLRAVGDGCPSASSPPLCGILKTLWV